jgi:hypothetical protein
MTEFKSLCLSHGNERIGRRVHKKLRRRPVQGIESHIAHPTAAALGVRSQGPTQIMDAYPGNWLGNLDEIAAAETMEWLGDAVNNEEVIIPDIHSNSMPGCTYSLVGERALKASMGSSYLLGYDKCVVSPSSFTDHVQNAVLLETSTSSRRDEREAAEKLYRGLSRLALLDISQLQKAYEDGQKDIQFLKDREIAAVPGDYPTDVVFADDELLRQLETIPSPSALTKIDLPADVRRAFGLEGDGNLFTGSWGYNNMSADLPDRGQYNGRPRKSFFGNILYEIPPPVDQGDWVTFKDI